MVFKPEICLCLISFQGWTIHPNCTSPKLSRKHSLMWMRRGQKLLLLPSFWFGWKKGQCFQILNVINLSCFFYQRWSHWIYFVCWQSWGSFKKLVFLFGWFYNWSILQNWLLPSDFNYSFGTGNLFFKAKLNY